MAESFPQLELFTPEELARTGRREPFINDVDDVLRFLRTSRDALRTLRDAHMALALEYARALELITTQGGDPS